MENRTRGVFAEWLVHAEKLALAIMHFRIYSLQRLLGPEVGPYDKICTARRQWSSKNFFRNAMKNAFNT